MLESTHVNKLITDNVPAMWSRIENSVLTGMCDLHGINFSRDVFIESKLFTGNKIIVRAAQNAWMTKRILHGGRAFIAARKLDDLLFFEASKLPALIDAGVVVIKKPAGGPGAAVKTNTAARPARRVTLDTAYGMANLVVKKPYDWLRVTRFLFGGACQ